MKLKQKITIAFCFVVLVVAFSIGTVAYYKSSAMGINDAKNTMKISADLAAKDIEGKLDDFKSMAQVSGYDSVLATSALDEAVAARIDNMAQNFGFTSGNVLDSNGISRKDGTDFSDREYVKEALAGNVNISDLTISKYTGNYGFSVAAPTYSIGNQINGVVYYRMDVDFLSNAMDQIVISDNSYTYLVDGSGMIIVHPDETLIGEYNITDEQNGLGSFGSKILSQECGSGEYDKNGTEYLCGYSPIKGTNGWTIVVVAPKDDFLGPVKETIKILFIVLVAALIYAFILAGFFAGSIGNAANKVSETLAFLAEGDLGHQIEQSKRKDEIGQLQNSARQLQQTFKQMIGETNTILGSMANYDLTQDSMNQYPGDFNQLSDSVNRIRIIMQRLIREVQEAASSVGMGSGELADAADALAAGTVTQASSINQLVSNVEDMAECIARNSENEDRIKKRLEQLDNLIVNGNSEMQNLREVVCLIESMSADIQNIVGTIESIAFQINILALNASVEAARAGESGRGFAVVADEVGNLATKTTESSKQTAELIVNCLKQIENAMNCADSTSNCLYDIVQNSEQISKAFKEIAIDTKEQADKSTRIKFEISNISDVVQTNTATAEETAAATQELSEQAKALSGLISKFRV